MIQRTLAQARPQIARIIATSGMNTSDGRILDRINLATEELINEGDWPGIVDRYLFQTSTGNIILPSFLDRILGVAVNNIPYSIRSPWYEFVEYGPGPQNACGWMDAVIDRGETAIQVPFPDQSQGPWRLFALSPIGETGVLRVQGTDKDGREVRTNIGSWIEGEQIFFSADKTPGSILWGEIASVEKPQTNNYLELWAQSDNGYPNVLLATFNANETTPSYHGYFLPSLRCGPRFCCSSSENQNGTFDPPLNVLVRAKKRFVPVTDDADVLMIGNLPALASMVMAIQKRDVSDIDGYAGYKGAAIGMMRAEALSYLGKVKAPAITFERGASFGDFTYVR